MSTKYGEVSMERTIRFALWAGSMRVVTVGAIRDHWKVCRATAYRWLVAWHAANGMYHSGERPQSKPYVIDGVTYLGAKGVLAEAQARGSKLRSECGMRHRLKTLPHTWESLLQPRPGGEWAAELRRRAA